MKETELLARDAQRDLNAELLDSIAEMKAGKVGRVSLVTRDGQVPLVEDAAKPLGHIKLGSLLADMGHQVALTDEEIALFNERDKSVPRPVSFE